MALPGYLVEAHPVPLQGEIEQTVRHIRDHFSLQEGQYHAVPHLSLYGGFSLRPEYSDEDVISTLFSVLKRRKPAPFTIAGYERRRTGRTWAIAFAIAPSRRLLRLRRSIARALNPLTIPEYDRDIAPGFFAKGPDVWLHITIARGLSDEECDGIWAYLMKIERDGRLWGRIKRRLGFSAGGERKAASLKKRKSAVLRVALIAEGRPAAAWDLQKRRPLSGQEIHNRTLWKESLLSWRGD